jgi:hypothetical protein
MPPTNSIQDLTPADWKLHKQELALLQAHLFKHRSPKSLYVAGDAIAIAPSVVVCWYPPPPQRTLLKGGLKFRLHFPGAHGPSWCSVQHWHDDRYWIHANYVDHRGASYSRFSLTRPFEQLPGELAACVDTMAREFSMP